MNQYADSLFTSFSIDYPESEDKKGDCVFTVDGVIIYEGMTNDSLKKVMMKTYGNIILYKDVQLIPCRLSAFLNANHNKNIELWAIDCDDKEKINQIEGLDKQ